MAADLSRLNIFYLMLEKIQEFANGKYELAPTINDITDGYESRRTDAREQIEALQINKRLVSTGNYILFQHPPFTLATF